MSASRRWEIPLVAVALLVLAAQVATAQVATAVLQEGQAVPNAPGLTCSSLQNPATNSIGGWVINFNGTTGSETLSTVWGSVDGVSAPAIIRQEGVFGEYTQTSYEFQLGFGDGGQVGYSPTLTKGATTGLDSVWIDSTPIIVEGDPVPVGPAVGRYWTFGSAVSLDARGKAYFVAGTSATPTGSSSQYGFFDSDLNYVLYASQELPGLPARLDDTSQIISFEYKVSRFGNNYIGPVTMETTGTGLTTSNDNAIVINGEALYLGGSIVREDQTLPASVGGEPNEVWDNFRAFGISDSGEYLITGDSDKGVSGTAKDEFVVVNGSIAIREGDVVDGYTISGAIEFATMNDSGDWAVVWDADVPAVGNVECLIFNGHIVLLEEVTTLDLTGDGIPDAGSHLTGTGFTGTRCLAISDRSPTSEVSVYFTGNATDGINPTTEYFFRLPLPVTPGPDGDIQLTITDQPDPLTVLPGKIKYTVAVRNNGPAPATGVSVVSTLPPTVTFDPVLSDPIAQHSAGVVTAAIGDLGPYGVFTYAFYVDVPNAGLRTTTSTVSANEADPVPDNNTVVNETLAGLQTDLVLSITDSPDPLYVKNGQSTYTVTARNNGPSAATGIVATLTLDPNTEFVSTTLGTHAGGVVTADIPPLGNNAATSFDVVVTALNTGTLEATGSIAGGQEDPDLSNNTEVEQTVYALLSDLSVMITDSPDPVTPVAGGVITYTVTVKNGGPSAVEGAEATLTLDGTTSFVSASAGSHDGSPIGGVVTVPVGDLAPSAEYVFTVTAATLAAGRSYAVAAVTHSGPQEDPAGNNNVAPTYTLVYDTLPALPIGVYSSISGHPTSVVPGVPDGVFEDFDRPQLSPNSKLWILPAITTAASAADEIIIVGSGCTANTLVQEGVTQLDPNGYADIVGTMDAQVSINDAGDFVFAADTNAATTSDEVIVKYSAAAGGFIVVAREGEAAAPTGYNYGSVLHSPKILQNGQVWFVGDTTNPDTTADYFLFQKNGNAVVLQEGVTAPTGLVGAGVWDEFDTGDFSINATGTVWGIQGDTSAATTEDDIFAVNNAVMVQESIPLAGSGFTAGAREISFGEVQANGAWLARGGNQDAVDWVIRNGSLLAVRGEPVVPGSAEHYTDAWFSDDFFSFAANNSGAYLVGGCTDAGGYSSNDDSDAILVLNGQHVVVREGDPIDLDGNGVLDDNVRIRTFGNDDLVLTDDFQAYFNVTMRGWDDPSNAQVGTAFLRVNLCGYQRCGDLNNDNAVDGSDFAIFLAAMGKTVCDAEYHHCADYDQDGVVSLMDYQQWLLCYREFVGDLTAAPPPLPRVPEQQVVKPKGLVPIKGRPETR